VRFAEIGDAKQFAEGAARHGSILRAGTPGAFAMRGALLRAAADGSANAFRRPERDARAPALPDGVK